MEDTSEPGHDHEETVPSGAMVREHWDTWTRFTGMTKIGIVVVAAVVIFSMFFITR